MTGWVYIKKGATRPWGDVLVARRTGGDAEDRLAAAIWGEKPEWRTTVTIAHWHRGRKKWTHGPRGEEVRGVYAWAALPDAPFLPEEFCTREDSR